MNKNCHGRSKQNLQRLKQKAFIKKPVQMPVVNVKVPVIIPEKNYLLKDCVIEIDTPAGWGTHHDVGMGARTIDLEISQLLEQQNRHIF